MNRTKQQRQKRGNAKKWNGMKRKANCYNLTDMNVHMMLVPMLMLLHCAKIWCTKKYILKAHARTTHRNERVQFSNGTPSANFGFRLKINDIICHHKNKCMLALNVCICKLHLKHFQVEQYVWKSRWVRMYVCHSSFQRPTMWEFLFSLYPHTLVPTHSLPCSLLIPCSQIWTLK